MDEGRVVGIFIGAEATVLPVAVTSVVAKPHCGLTGDRYCDTRGTFSQATPAGPGRELTLIEQEALDHLRTATGIDLSPAESRRNLLTAGVALNDLVGKQFFIGEVLAEGIRLCQPCGHLEKLTGKPVREGLQDRGGLRANILSEGTIRLGDAIRPAPLVPATALA